MRFLKTNKAKVMLIMLVFAIIGGVVYNTGVTKKSKADVNNYDEISKKVINVETQIQQMLASTNDVENVTRSGFNWKNKCIERWNSQYYYCWGTKL